MVVGGDGDSGGGEIEDRRILEREVVERRSGDKDEM